MYKVLKNFSYKGFNAREGEELEQNLYSDEQIINLEQKGFISRVEAPTTMEGLVGLETLESEVMEE